MSSPAPQPPPGPVVHGGDNLAAFKAANAAYAASFRRDWAEKCSALGPQPGKHVAVLTCMDARLHPNLFLGLDVGDAHVLRNGGGQVTEDVLRSLALSQRLLGTREVHVIHHTDCGMTYFDNPTVVHKLKEDLGVDVTPDYDFLPIKDLEQSVKDDVQALKESPLIAPDTPIYGHIYDTFSGKLTLVETDGPKA